MRLTLSQIIAASGSQTLVAPADPGLLAESISWDSRQIQAGGVFLAIQGESVDGNDFCEAALDAGAALLIASRPPDVRLQDLASRRGAGLVYVAEPESALGDIAKLWRGLIKPRVIGVTGSSGKTSTKELIAAVLGGRYRTQANPGNYNNLLGLPATLLDCRDETEMLVLEMGMQGRGEIARYCEIARPDTAVYTNIGLAHLEFLGSQEAIAQAKSELLAALPTGGSLAVLNGDDPYTLYLLDHTAAASRGIEAVCYGLGLDNDVQASGLTFNNDGMPAFTAHLAGGGRLAIRLRIAGAHNVMNCLAALALGERLGVPEDAMQAAVEAARPLALRSEQIDLAGGSRVINDSYNANPDSMRASLLALRLMAQPDGGGLDGTPADADPARPLIAVLGDMNELGADEEALHRQVGRLAAESGLALLVTVGAKARWIADQAALSGMPAQRIRQAAGWQEAVAILRPEIGRSRSIILVKASRGMALEHIVEALREEFPAPPGLSPLSE
ncbi:MAG: UDP-N-acetylmuramoyl-tripeptide--D-alanyl-D-alanine ligase [Coriobacteriia bacterium]|nr:UDP-N-acetylmuramoyl-tripeptide--D-alanyl-D-alanine ligase [Coriobacteriia bacterium]